MIPLRYTHFEIYKRSEFKITTVLQFHYGHKQPPNRQEESHDTPVSTPESSHCRTNRIEVNFLNAARNLPQEQATESKIKRNNQALTQQI